MANSFTTPYRLSSRQLATIIVLWALTALAGFAVLIDHDLRTGSAGVATSHWPDASSLARSQAGPTLVMFIHPHCPCTAASLEQLGELASHKEFAAATSYLLIADVAESLSGDNVALARNIPGAIVRVDSRGSEAQHFGGRTSGATFIYDAAGRLTFDGGITAARGHQGQNPASAAALAALQGGSDSTVHMPVFGCALSSDALADDLTAVD